MTSRDMFPRLPSDDRSRLRCLEAELRTNVLVEHPRLGQLADLDDICIFNLRNFLPFSSSMTIFNDHIPRICFGVSQEKMTRIDAPSDIAVVEYPAALWNGSDDLFVNEPMRKHGEVSASSVWMVTIPNRDIGVEICVRSRPSEKTGLSALKVCALGFGDELNGFFWSHGGIL